MKQQFDTYLFFDGTCAEAMRFYERTLGAKLNALMKYSESPDPDRFGTPWMVSGGAVQQA